MKFDKQTANQIIAQLSHVLPLLAQGRALGIDITASAEAIEALSQSDHPDKVTVLGNLPLSR